NYGKEKQLGKEDFTVCPNGAPGVEERLSLMYSEGVAKGRISMHQLVKTLCTNPARIYGLYPRKGAVLPGADGDLVILDPAREYVLTHERMHGAVDHTCYEGFRIQGEIRQVIQRGRVLVDGQRFLGERGNGRFICRRIAREY
ncbi:MAG: amidohydrolase family protein, partial [Dorea sp.]|nr:amidohydrolase family protein [Dorea sp.]